MVVQDYRHIKFVLPLSLCFDGCNSITGVKYDDCRLKHIITSLLSFNVSQIRRSGWNMTLNITASKRYRNWNVDPKIFCMIMYKKIFDPCISFYLSFYVYHWLSMKWNLYWYYNLVLLQSYRTPSRYVYLTIKKTKLI